MGVPAGPWYIDDTLTFTTITHRFDTGALTDADSVPSYRVYEDETGTAILTGSMAKLDDANTTGFYSEQLTLSAANGFEVGKSYSIYVTAAVNSVTGGQTFNFKVIAATYPANVTQFGGTAGTFAAGRPEVNTTHAAGTAWGSGAITAASIAADAITAAKVAADVSAEIADAVWDEDATGHQTQGTFGQAIGDPVADANTIYGAVVTGAAGATVAADIIAIKAETASIQTDTDAIEVDTQDIQGRLPAALVSGRIDASVGAMAANVMTAAATAADYVTELQAGIATAADLATVATYIDTEVAAIKAKTDQLTFTVANQVDANALTVGDKAGYSLSAAGIDAIWDEIMEGAVTARQSLRLANAANGGKTNGAGTGTFNIRDLADTKNRVVATNSSGNRTAVTLDLT